MTFPIGVSEGLALITPVSARGLMGERWRAEAALVEQVLSVGGSAAGVPRHHWGSEDPGPEDPCCSTSAQPAKGLLPQTILRYIHIHMEK